MAKGASPLSADEKKAILEILAFYKLERSIQKQYSGRKLGRIKRLIKKKWKKVLPLIEEGHLMLDVGVASEAAREWSDIIRLYSEIYSDLFGGNGAIIGVRKEAIQKISEKGIKPALDSELEERIDRIVAPKTPIKPGKKAAVKAKTVEEYPSLDPLVRPRLVKEFKRRLKEEEPLMMMDSKMQLRLENFIRRHVDRIIDVSLEHAYKAVQYGYINKTQEALSNYVEGKSKESIEWTIKSGVLIRELVKGMT